jgi:glycosyltransferase involved in cell wall biosynthesis
VANNKDNIIPLETVKYCFVMPLFNASKWMKKAIDSILAQTYNNWELICVDDGSSDDTRSVAKSYLATHSEKIRLLEQENAGPAAAREKAILLTESDYVVFLDSDDYISSDYLAEINKKALTNPDVIIPELMSQDTDGGFYSFNAANKLRDGGIISGVNAFRLTFPWRIHGFSCYKTGLMKNYATGANANYNKYNADEFVTRVVFLNSKEIVISGGKYYHTENPQSITKTPSKRRIEFLLTEVKLIELTETFDSGYINHVKTDSLKKFVNSYLNLLSNKRYFEEEEFAAMMNTYKQFYRHLKSTDFSFTRAKTLSAKEIAYRLVKLNMLFIIPIVFINRLLS